MTWQRSLETAVRALKKEENVLLARLDKLRSKIGELETMARDGRAGARGRPASKRRLSPQGRAAISKAAKRRWQKYRSDKAKQAKSRAR
jgi:hypothetical protein